MKSVPFFIAVLSVGALASGPSIGQTSRQANTAEKAGGAKHVRITYENLTTGQAFSPSVFVSHNASAPALFKEGEKVSFGMMRLAEEGNGGPLQVGIVKELGKAYGAVSLATATLPGQSRTVDIEVTRDFPMISGAFMLVMTNDGFTGVNGLNVYEMTGPKTIDLMAWEAGTEKNNEKKAFMVSFMGAERDPEGGVVQKHAGIRGDADAPAEWKFDPAQPVARITITPVPASETTGAR
jgi:Spondin_N